MPGWGGGYVLVDISLQFLLQVDYLEIVDGRIQLKRSSNYYYQVQGQLHITKKQRCIFYVYVPNKADLAAGLGHPRTVWDVKCEITRDDNFWRDEMLPHLEK